jgi:hypothetical protein
MARFPKGAENKISVVFVVMCAEKIRRLLYLFFGPFCLVLFSAMASPLLDQPQKHLEA